jgi:hypothetical protein
MPRPKHKHEDLVRELIVAAAEAGEPHRGPEKLRQDMEDLVDTGKLRISKLEIPTAVTIGRIKRRFPESERAAYAFVRFPSTFDTNQLPWESAADVLMLWRALNIRPSIRLARRFYQVKQALGDVFDTRGRFLFARRMLEADEHPSLWSEIERDLISFGFTGDPRTYGAETELVRSLPDRRWIVDWDGAVVKKRERDNATDE